MSFRRSGLNPLAYGGVEPISLSPDVAYKRDPTQNDINFNLSTRWLNTVDQELFVLVNLDAGVAEWVRLTGQGGAGLVASLTTDDATVVVPNVNGNINVFGAHGINTVGTAGPNTVTVRVDNTLTLGDESDVGVTPSLTLETGILEIVNGNAIIGNTEVSPFASSVEFQKSRTGAVITTGDDLGSINFEGYDGTSYTTAAQIISESSGTIAAGRVAGNLQFFTHPDAATPIAQRMVINPDGSVLINTPDAGGADALTVTGNIAIPDTTADGIQGEIKFGGDRFITNYGTDNTFVGSSSGNLTLTVLAAENNTAIGTDTLQSLTMGANNSVVGDLAGSQITEGIGNSALGSLALSSLLDGDTNIAIGASAGLDYVGSESSNILLNSVGVVGESNTLRIGQGSGTGDGELSTAYISGVYGVTPGGMTPLSVIMDENGQLGTGAGGGGGATDFVTDAGTAIEAGGILNVLGGVGITTSAVGNTVTITNTGGGGPGGTTDFVTDAGTAIEVGGTINIIGGAGISTSGAGDTVTITNTGGVSALVLLDTQVAAGSASLDFTTGISGTYNTYMLVLDNLIPSDNGGRVVILRFSTNGGATYLSAGYTAGLSYFAYNSATDRNFSARAGDIPFAVAVSNTALGYSGTAYIYNATSASLVSAVCSGTATGFAPVAPTGPYLTFYSGGGYYSAGNITIDALQVLIPSATIVSGTVSLYGVLQ